MTNQQGVGFIEVLISLVVLTIGLLGLVALQAAAIRFNYDGQQRSVAVMQVHVMADRIRTNQSGATAGNYNNINSTVTVPSNPSCTTCSPAEVAQRDTYEWITAIRNLLPRGEGQVIGAGGLYTIKVMWDSQKTGATGINCSDNPQVDLTCIQVSVRI